MSAALELEPTPAIPRCINRRVDYLTIAYQVQMTDAVRDLVRQRSQAAGELGGGAAELELEGFTASLKRPRTRGAEKWPIENGDMRGMIEFHASGGWNLEVTVRAPYLATHRLEQCVELAQGVAEAFGEVKAIRLRRFDLCADFDGFPLCRDDAEGFLIPRRGKLCDFRPENDVEDRELAQPERRTYQDAAARITGFTICPKGDVQGRIYDKSAELCLAGREEKRELEAATWKRNGWDGSAQVSRVEFQLRGTALDEMKLRDPRELPKALDSVWAYLTSRVVERGLTWLRLCAPETATRRARCDLDERWTAVQRVVFVHESTPVRRLRKRGGATWAQTLGSMLSAMASQSALGRVDIDHFRKACGELPKTKQGNYASAWGLQLLLDLHVTAAMHAHSAFFGAANRVSELELDPEKPTEMQTPRDAALELGERINAVWARFRSSDDGDELPDRWELEVSPEGVWTIRLVASTGRVPDIPDRYDKAERDALHDA